MRQAKEAAQSHTPYVLQSPLTVLGLSSFQCYLIREYLAPSWGCRMFLWLLLGSWPHQSPTWSFCLLLLLSDMGAGIPHNR